MTAKFAPGAIVYTADDPVSWPSPQSPVSGAAHIISVIDCSTNPNYPAAVQGDIYKVSVAGRLGGASGAQVDVGDVAIAMQDSAAGDQAAVGANWTILEHNLVGALLAANNLSDLSNIVTARSNMGLGTVAVLASDTDGTMAANSDLVVATQKALVTFVNNQIAAAGAGDVVGPASAVSGNFPVFNGTTGKLVSDSGVAPANFVQTTRTVNGHALSANVTVTASDVGLGSVTNDAQTKAAIVPNTAPAAGGMLVGNAGATAYAPVAASGAVTLASTGAFSLATPGTLTVTTTNTGGTGAHVHTITSSNNPGAAASLLATDASGHIGVTANRIVKIWALDLTVTNNIAGSITGNAATVTTNANLTGPITSSGNTTSVASQTGTGTKFVMDTSPALVTPNIGVAAGTSLAVSGLLTSSSPSAGIGYAVGAGAAIAQGAGSGKATAIASNTMTGQITMNAASLAANTTVSFTFTNTSLGILDTLQLNIVETFSSASYNIWAGVGAGSAIVNLRNITAGALAQALVVNYTIIKGRNS